MTKILVIEDVQILREEILEALECLEFDVVGAENGVVGVEQAKLHLPDLILCDVMMPELDGYGVYEALRENSETAIIPFIFLSAKADKSDIRQGMNLGADDYLTKPFTTSELSDAITARLQKQAKITQPYITEMKRAAEHLSQLAYRDPLTNLPNRILLHQRLQEAIAQAKRHQYSIGILCLNLSRFKLVNAALGHLIGDRLLQAVAQRLTQCVSSNDTVARLSGDEFSVVLTGITQKPDLVDTAQQILNKLSEPYDINGEEILIQLSMGITVYPEDNSNQDKLLNHADTAMRRAKRQGSSAYQLYNPDLDTLIAKRQFLETYLGHAIERSELEVYYQPQINLITGRIIGTEALLRWQHPNLGTISPSTFIPIAEETGLIFPIGEWLLHQVCTQAGIWQTSNFIPIRVSVNLSARQFKQQNLITLIAQALRETGLDPNRLELELTETSLMEDVDMTIATLLELKAMGIQISIDDFGTGYSSLNYLRRFPLDTLKIDQSFVSHVVHDANDAAIATAIIAMAQSLKLKVIAEGVETEEQFNFLRQHGCYAMQGFLFSPPLPAAEFEQLLAENKRLQIFSA